MLLFSVSMSFAAFPVELTIVNNTSVDLTMVVKSRHLDVDAVQNLKNQTIYGSETHIFRLDRTDDPATLFIVFRADGGEAEVTGYDVGEWQYVEYALNDRVAVFKTDTCHNVFGKSPFEVTCEGNNNFAVPRVRLTIDYQQK